MKLTKNVLFLGILIFGLIANLLVYFDIQYFYLRAVLSFVFLTTIPGLLIMLMFKIRKIGLWEYFVYTIGLSIAFLMFGGLLVNWVLPLTGINQPLSLQPLSTSLNFFLLIFGLVAYLRNKDISYEFKFTKPSLLNWVFSIIPITFPILSILGAISLNNHGPNTLTMIMLGGIVLYVFSVIIFRKKINDNIYPFSILFIAMSLLFMTSLRGWYTTGHDNQQEYYVFQMVKSNYHWNISLFHEAYNACLSLNILPTIFSSFLNINDLYIFKILFQCIYPFSVIGIFLLLKKYAIRPIAFLSTFFFMSFSTFGNDMPMLNRQEISLLFFTLSLLVLFNKNFKPRFKEILFLIFAFSMVVSHFSTSYVAAALITLTYLTSFITKRISEKKILLIGNKRYYLTFLMVIGMVFFIFFWTVQLTNTANGLTNLITQSWQNIGKSFSQDLKSSDVLYSIFNWQNIDKNKLLNQYVEKEKRIKTSNIKSLYFDKNIYQKYKISLAKDDTLPLTTLGRILKNISIDAFSLNYYFKQVSAKLVQLLIVIGFAIILFKKSIYLKKIDSEFDILAFISIGLLGLFTLLPIFSIEYGMLRFFLQTLTILALPTIIGCLMVFRFLKKDIRLYATLTFFIFFFLSFYGFIPQLTGGFYPLLNLNNQGLYYDVFYTHKSEVDSIRWLSVHFNNEFLIQSNFFARSKMLAIAKLYSPEKILPVTIRKDTYVYLDYSNVKNRKNTIFYKGNLITYDYSVEFLNENKNLIYNNGGSEVFK